MVTGLTTSTYEEMMSKRIHKNRSRRKVRHILNAIFDLPAKIGASKYVRMYWGDSINKRSLANRTKDNDQAGDTNE